MPGVVHTERPCSPARLMLPDSVRIVRSPNDERVIIDCNWVATFEDHPEANIFGCRPATGQGSVPIGPAVGALADLWNLCRTRFRLAIVVVPPL